MITPSCSLKLFCLLFFVATITLPDDEAPLCGFTVMTSPEDNQITLMRCAPPYRYFPQVSFLDDPPDEFTTLRICFLFLLLYNEEHPNLLKKYFHGILKEKAKYAKWLEKCFSRFKYIRPERVDDDLVATEMLRCSSKNAELPGIEYLRDYLDADLIKEDGKPALSPLRLMKPLILTPFVLNGYQRVEPKGEKVDILPLPDGGNHETPDILAENSFHNGDTDQHTKVATMKTKGDLQGDESFTLTCDECKATLITKTDLFAMVQENMIHLNSTLSVDKNLSELNGTSVPGVAAESQTKPCGDFECLAESLANMEKENEELMETLVNKNETISKLEAEVEAVGLERINLLRTLEHIRRVLVEKDKRINALAGGLVESNGLTVAQILQKNNKLTVELEKVEEDNATLNQAYRELRNEHVSLMATLSEKETQCQELTEKLKQAVNLVTALQIEAKAKELVFKKKEKKLGNVQKEFNYLKEEFKHLVSDFIAKAEELASTNRLLKMKENEAQKYKYEINDLTVETQLLASKLHERILNNRGIELKLFQMEMDHHNKSVFFAAEKPGCEDNENGLKVMEEELFHSKLKIHAVEKEKELLKSEIEQLKVTLIEKDNKINQLTEEKDHLRDGFEDLQLSMTKLKYELSSKADHVKVTEEQLAKILPEISSLQLLINSKNQIIDETNSKMKLLEIEASELVAEKERQVRDLLSELESLKSSLACMVKTENQYIEEINELRWSERKLHEIIIAKEMEWQYKVQEKERTLIQNNKEIIILKDRISELAHVVDTLTGECRFLKDSIAEKEKLCSHISSENSIFQEQNRILRNDLRDMRRGIKEAEILHMSLNAKNQKLEDKIKDLKTNSDLLKRENIPISQMALVKRNIKERVQEQHSQQLDAPLRKRLYFPRFQWAVTNILRQNKKRKKYSESANDQLSS